jgi:signal transduction histidine kinase
MTKQRTLFAEARFLIILITAIIIIFVEVISLWLISDGMIQDLKARALVTSNEIALLLKEPLYLVDDVQAKAIGEALLSSGRISGINLVSTISGSLLVREPKAPSHLISPEMRSIFHENTFLGSVELFFSDDEVVFAQNRFLQMSLVIVIAVILSSLLLIRFIIQLRVLKSLEFISSGINLLAGGDYEAVIPLGRYQDVNRFIRLINDMASRILLKNEQLLEANTSLEQRVASRTADLESSVRNLELAQNKLVLSEKLSALGKLSAGVAHELNTPLGAISSSIGLLSETIDTGMRDWLEFYARLEMQERQIFQMILDMALPECTKPPSGNERKIRHDIQGKLEEKGISNARQIAEQITEMRIADRFDRLVPYLDEPEFCRCVSIASQIVSTRKMAEIVSLAGNKATVVVGALRSYLREERSAAPESVDVASGIDTILTLLHNKIKQAVHVNRDYQSGRALGSSSLLNQVWMNLMNNALQAMNYQGTLTIKTETVDKLVIVQIIDSGSGIPDEIKDRIFEPFFTTKEYGEGMGLGLDICLRIIEQFNGQIFFKSRPGYTCFTVQLLAAK